MKDLKFIGGLVGFIFCMFCVVQSLVNVIGAMKGFGIDMDGSLRMWLIFSGGIVPSAGLMIYLIEKTLKK